MTAKSVLIRPQGLRPGMRASTCPCLGLGRTRVPPSQSETEWMDEKVKFSI